MHAAKNIAFEENAVKRILKIVLEISLIASQYYVSFMPIVEFDFCLRFKKVQLIFAFLG